MCNITIKIKKLFGYSAREKPKILYLILQLRKFLIFNRDRTFKKYVDFAFKYLNKPIPFQQVYNEILEFAKMLDKIKPTFVLEIGTAGGGSLFLISRAASDNASIISIDLPGGEGLGGEGYPAPRIPLYKSFAKSGQKIHLLTVDSHSPEALEKVKTILNGAELDLLFIDGDHSYEGVKKDFETYYPLVRKGGKIAFHDIVPSSRVHKSCKVQKFWEEIKHRYKYSEIVADWDQGSSGIGIINP